MQLSKTRTLCLAGIQALCCASANAQVTQRVSLSSSGIQSNHQSVPFSITPDGRYIIFESFANNLVPGDTNGSWDIFVRDRRNGTTERVSVGVAGVQGNASSYGGRISQNGRYVVFTSYATNLVSSDTNSDYDAFIRDRLLGVTELVSVSSAGTQSNAFSSPTGITPDGRFVVFGSRADNLVPGVPASTQQVYLRDRLAGTTELVSVDSNGAPGLRYSYGGSISANGQIIAFVSEANNLVPGDTNPSPEAFVHDRQSGVTRRVSVDSNGMQGVPFDGTNVVATISGDGNWVAFTSGSSNLVLGDMNGVPDVFVHNLSTGVTERISLGSGGSEANGESFHPWISQDGRCVAFASAASNLIASDTNVTWDVFIHDRQLGMNERASIDSAGSQGNGQSGSQYLSASPDGRFVVFDSYATNLVVGDMNGSGDVFLRDRFGGPDFTSLCDPGASGVIPCPCGNPPGGTGQGCDNSSGTGGAVLSASGGTYLSSDSLVFTTIGEKPTALSIVSQWTSFNQTAIVFGQGVRCTSGTLKRLYTKTASGGSITAPNFVAGDPQVSVRSAALGDTIFAGQSRWHFVYYRDPNVLGGCPVTSTFNCTQTGQVTWSP